jgi:hypothetical protein
LENDDGTGYEVPPEDMVEQGIDDRFDQAMTGAGFSSDEKSDIMSRDIRQGVDNTKGLSKVGIINDIFDLIRINDLDPEDVMEEVATEFNIAFEFGRASGMAKQAGTDAGFDMRGL